MIWSVYDFDTCHVIFPTFESSIMPKSLLDPECQCVVQRATTDEDRRYLGDDWQCMHCLVPESCVVCNPVYKQAVLADCTECAPAVTWHVDGKCLHCDEINSRRPHS